MKKKWIAFAIMIAAPSFVWAQEMRTETMPAKRSSTLVIPISQMDQSKIYNWGNGQRSTPAGRQAGEKNVRFAKVMGDSAIVVSRREARKYRKNN